MSWWHADHLGDVADVLEPFPGVFEPLHAEDKKQILRRESEDIAAAEGDPIEAPPQTFIIYGKREMPLRDRPMQIYGAPTVAVHKRMLTVVADQGRFLRRSEPVLRSVALCQ